MNRHKIHRLSLLLAAVLILLSGCMATQAPGEKDETWVPTEDIPKLPEKLKRDDATGIPLLRVYDVSSKQSEEIELEDYVMGVVAGEMKNDWPMEALKAQAILARTFVLKFCDDKTSKYRGADISTDVTEAQAYDAGSVNEQVRQAVEATRGRVMAWHGEFPNAWFHAHSGGMTELPSVSLDYREGDPEYLKPVRSDEAEEAPDSARRWEATFKLSEIKAACADAGLKTGNIRTIEVGEKGASGRAKTLLVNGEPVSAPSFRLQIGANRLKSTLIDSIDVGEDGVTFKGRGFGHGVGMSQWGAYAMAERGQSAEDIIRHYYSGIDIVRLW